MSLNRKTLGKHLERIFAQTREGAVDPKSVRALFIIRGEGTAISFQGATGSFAGIVPKGDGPTLRALGHHDRWASHVDFRDYLNGLKYESAQTR